MKDLGKTVIILNPAAAGGQAASQFKRVKDKIDFIFPKVPIRISERAGHAGELARQLAHEGCEQIIGVGGDGTFNEIVNGLFENREAINPNLVLGTLPIGTGSDFIRSLGIPNKLGEALSFMQRKKVASIDVGFARVQDEKGNEKEHLFLNILSCGLSAEVARRVNRTSNWGGPFFRYLRSSLLSIAQYDNENVKIRYSANDTHYEGPFTLLAVANGCYFGGGMFVAPQAHLDDGLFQIVLVKQMPKLSLFGRFPSIYKGDHLNLPDILTCQNSQIDVSSIGKPVYVEADGEPIGKLPLQVGCIPKALKIIVGNTKS